MVQTWQYWWDLRLTEEVKWYMIKGIRRIVFKRLNYGVVMHALMYWHNLKERKKRKEKKTKFLKWLEDDLECLPLLSPVIHQSYKSPQPIHSFLCLFFTRKKISFFSFCYFINSGSYQFNIRLRMYGAGDPPSPILFFPSLKMLFDMHTSLCFF